MILLIRGLSSGTAINISSLHEKPCVSWLRKTFCLKIFLLRLARITVHYCLEDLLKYTLEEKCYQRLLCYQRNIFSLFSVVKLQHLWLSVLHVQYVLYSSISLDKLVFLQYFLFDNRKFYFL